MTVAYVDPSVCLAIAIGHHWSPDLVGLLEGYDRLLCSPLLEAELECTLDEEQVRGGWPGLQRFDWVIPDRPLSGEIARVRDRGRLAARGRSRPKGASSPGEEVQRARDGCGVLQRAIGEALQ